MSIWIERNYLYLYYAWQFVSMHLLAHIGIYINEAMFSVANDQQPSIWHPYVYTYLDQVYLLFSFPFRHINKSRLWIYYCEMIILMCMCQNIIICRENSHRICIQLEFTLKTYLIAYVVRLISCSYAYASIVFSI